MSSAGHGLRGSVVHIIKNRSGNVTADTPTTAFLTEISRLYRSFVMQAKLP